MELAVRIASALVFGPALLAIIWYSNSLGYTTFIAALMAFAGWEWAKLAGAGSTLMRASFAIGMGAITLALITQATSEITQTLVLLGMLIWLANLSWLARPQLLNAANGTPLVLKVALGCVVLSVAGLSLARIQQAHLGQGLTIVFFLIIWSADIGAYGAGRLFGRRKLAPSISPGKSWEGVVGGQILVALVIWLLLKFTPEGLKLGSWLYPLAAITAAVSVVGDLFISVLKRQRELKDTGRLLPGHGGVLDRFDSTVAAAPFFLAGLYWAERLT
ncbi:MAG: phosphatidate cytidylyltransferase [Lysobacterales bacterium]